MHKASLTGIKTLSVEETDSDDRVTRLSLETALNSLGRSADLTAHIVLT